MFLSRKLFRLENRIPSRMKKKKMARSEYGEGKRKGTTSRIIRGGTSGESSGW